MRVKEHISIGLFLLALTSFLAVHFSDYFFGVTSIKGSILFVLFTWTVAGATFAHSWKHFGPGEAGKRLIISALVLMSFLILMIRSERLMNAWGVLWQGSVSERRL